MAFHDIELPQDFQYTSASGPGFATIVQESASGHEYRIARQSQGRHRFRLAKFLQTTAEANTLRDFALGRRGSLHSFKLTDWADYTSNSDGTTAGTNVDQVIGTGDGTETVFQLVKHYETSGPNAYTRTITLPQSGTVVTALDAVNETGFTVNAQGQVTFSSAPGVGVSITAGFSFYVPVRFEKDFDEWAQLQADAYDVWSLPQMECIEVLDEVQNPERWYPGGATDWGSITTAITLSLNGGNLQYITAGAAVNVYLPAVSRIPSGGGIFTIHVDSSSAFDIQLRDEEGTAVGSAFGNGGATKYVGLAKDGANSTWILY